MQSSILRSVLPVFLLARTCVSVPTFLNEPRQSNFFTDIVEALSNWETAQCTDPGITNAAQNQTVRWNDVDTDSAWAAAVASWNADPYPAGLTFTEQVSNFFHGPENMLCGVTVDHNGCGSPIECSDVNHPAGYFIINSLEQINNINLNFYDAIGRVEGQLTAVMGTFASTFAPIQDESTAEKLILDLIGLGFALAASPMWNSVLKGFTFFSSNPNTLGTLKDDINPLVSNGVTIAKDLSISGTTAIVENTLENNMGNMISIWYDTINNINADLFNGSDASIAQLGLMITGGQLIEPGSTLSDPQIQQYLEQAIYGYLIPQAWSLSNKGIHPFVLDSGFDCSAVNPLPKYMSDSTGDATYICYNNKLYYLMSVTGSASHCDEVPCGISQCTDNFFSAPPGIGALDGTAYGGVKKDDFIIGALAGYAANNNQNGWPAADATNSDTISALYDTGIQTPGVVQIPVCSASVAFENWLEGSAKDPNYPCQAVSNSRKREMREKLIAKRLLERAARPC